ncbi:NAD(P)-binding protein [Lophiostoma macrostomum CBS 122681]|uniref:NAD(P)-binding protein n=1 Tax=Lophiostoma macrostomum CBS 122681 TaxID=1314788 RepID=A0A6A6SWZ6_9PLEO|nr:NAD(P)-binding protein [Lophiostoma macrostomum CBS 122681]
MASPNYISKVAIVGAGGNIGSQITDALLKTGKHALTALVRTDTQSKLPEGVTSKTIDYEQPQTIVDALKGQDALVITLGGFVPKDTQSKLLHAAVEAGVPWVFPNEWSPDSANEELVKDVFIFQSKGATRKEIESLGKISYIAVSTGFWYEWSLAIPAAFGIDIANRTATFFDEGETKMSTSTMPQVGRAVAAILSLPIKAEGSSQEGSLEGLKNRVVYVNSFTVTQKDMLESVLRTTSTKEDDWKITKRNVQEWYSEGLEEMKKGERIGFVKMMYGRVFYPDGCGDFEHNKGTINHLLDLPKEDIDEATLLAIERSKGPRWV